MAVQHGVRGQGSLYVDNVSAFVKAMRDDPYLFSISNATREEAEILEQICQIKDTGRVQWTITWVQGHQKDKNMTESRLKAIADELAGEAYELPSKWKASLIAPSFPAIKFSVRIQKSAVHAKGKSGRHTITISTK